MKKNQPPPDVEVAATWEPIDSITGWDRNPRKHSDAHIADIRREIERDAWGAVIVVQASTRRIIAGHGRLLAARAMGLERVPVRAVDVDDAQAARMALADNQLTHAGAWDDEALAEVLRELASQEIDLKGIGWSDEELDALLADPGPTVEPTDEAPAVQPGPADSVLGRVYELGAHRLVCGDSTKAETWAALLGEERWSMVMTSPPYAQQRDYGAAKEHVQDWRGLMLGVFGSAIVHAEPDGQMLVNLGLIHRDRRVVRYWDPWLADMDERGWYLFGWYVWDQGSGLPGDMGGRLMPSHEWLFHLQSEATTASKTVEKMPENVGKKGKGLRGADGAVSGWSSYDASLSTHKVPDSVARVSRDASAIRSEHPAVFPVGLPKHLIPVWTDEGDIVAEPFGGSGTTLLACAATGRTARLIELDPKYCDVIRRRWTRYAKEAGIDPGSGALDG